MKTCISSLDRLQSGHAMLSPFFQPRYSTVLKKKSNNLLPTFSRCAAVNYYTLYSVRKMGITRLLCYSTVSQKREFASFCCSQLHCIEFNVPGTNISIKQLRGKNALLQNRTRSTLSWSVFATTEPGIVCLRRLKGVDRRGNACPPVAYISDLIRVFFHAFQLVKKWLPEKNNNLKNRAEEHTQTKNLKHKQRAPHGSTLSTENET